MENLNEIVTLTRKMNWKMKALFLLFTVLFILSIYIALAPLHKMKEFEKQVNADSLFIKNYKDIYSQPELRPLMKEKGFKEALLKLAESDSIQLVVDLSDLSVNLSIKGVMIHQTKIKCFSRDRLFKDLPVKQQLVLFSQPLTVQSQYATIVKEPVVIRQAPKDTLEAALNAWQPDTLLQNPAFVILTVEHGINIIFEQEENPTFKDKWKKFSFHERLFFRSSVKALSNFARFKKQDYQPSISIKMPVNDLRAIYRALPDHTLVVINL